MGIDWRLYVGTLVATLIFFGLGVLVGIGLTREPTARRLEGQIRRLEDRLSRELGWRDERIRELEARLATTDRHWTTMQRWLTEALPILVDRRLMFRNIALVVCAPDPDNGVIERVRETLLRAGAQVPATITFQPDIIAAADINAWRTAARQLGLVVGDDVPEDALRAGVWKRLALLVRYGDTERRMNALTALGWAKVAGNLTTPLGSAVVFVAFQQPREKEQVQAVDLPFVQALHNVGVRTVACETTTTQNGSPVEWLRGTGIATVDHVDTPMGMVCVIAALTGHPDHYGMKLPARTLLPPVNAFTPRP
ncbi:hypothetical protein HRbin17_02667 [bacterium HR17]|uniref:Copper transporter MctB n=1 Tax=Candidatus Fervidibacter japonicus TaxID=2035412 RepID=A0A2H5XG23_9BACT|nr:hypothetical protein HRbin17_02667 [bacterium HR17]